MLEVKSDTHVSMDMSFQWCTAEGHCSRILTILAHNRHVNTSRDKDNVIFLSYIVRLWGQYSHALLCQHCFCLFFTSSFHMFHVMKTFPVELHRSLLLLVCQGGD
jgi:hypothetical protein